jgi:hypothetical protein
MKYPVISRLMVQLGFLSFPLILAMPKAKEPATPTRKSSRIQKQPSRRHSPKKTKNQRKKYEPKKKRNPPPPQEEPVDPASKEYPPITNPLKVTCPVADEVHPLLSQAWVIHNGNPMWFIFDAHSPARHFKRGVRFQENLDFPGYSEPPYGDLTETDKDPPGLMPFAPWEHKYVHQPYG